MPASPPDPRVGQSAPGCGRFVAGIAGLVAMMVLENGFGADKVGPVEAARSLDEG